MAAEKRHQKSLSGGFSPGRDWTICSEICGSQILPLAGGQIVQAADPVVHAKDRLAQVGSDKARTAGHEKQAVFGTEGSV